MSLRWEEILGLFCFLRQKFPQRRKQVVSNSLTEWQASKALSHLLSLKQAILPSSNAMFKAWLSNSLDTQLVTQ